MLSSCRSTAVGNRHRSAANKNGRSYVRSSDRRSGEPKPTKRYVKDIAVRLSVLRACSTSSALRLRSSSSPPEPDGLSSSPAGALSVPSDVLSHLLPPWAKASRKPEPTWQAGAARPLIVEVVATIFFATCEATDFAMCIISFRCCYDCCPCLSIFLVALCSCRAQEEIWSRRGARSFSELRILLMAPYIKTHLFIVELHRSKVACSFLWGF